MSILPFLMSVVALAAPAEDWKYKDDLRAQLVKHVPTILKTFDPKTGRFGTGIWICGDQEAMYPLAVAYATPGAGNPYYKDPKLLSTIAKAGHALIADADSKGQWEFRKKDGSTWGKIWMPWTYSRWMRTYGLIGKDLAAEDRDAWSKALILGYTGIARSLGQIHNIPTHHAMGLYIAGKALDRPEWCSQATEFLRKAAAVQTPGGYWTEGGGPVVLYNFVYVDALGIYYALSHDEQVLPALRRAAEFHWHFTYPDGRNVETIDQRNPYHETVELGNVGFSLTPLGRAYLRQQWACMAGRRPGGEKSTSPARPASSARTMLPADLIASMLLYGQEGPTAPSSDSAGRFLLTENGTPKALTLRQGPWFVCLSAYTAAVAKNRWHQDRQNFVSLFHDRCGLLIGGGNTKLQPAWSTFTVGDTRLLAHKPGDTNPDFLPKGPLVHVPSEARLLETPELGLELTYGQEKCWITLQLDDDRRASLTLRAAPKGNLPVAGHLTLLPRLGTELVTLRGARQTLADSPWDLAGDVLGGGFRYAGCQWQVPAAASVHWPRRSHNPYARDGRSTLHDARVETNLPFAAATNEQRVEIRVAE